MDFFVAAKWGVFNEPSIAYSYQAEQYKPLGLEIFRQRVEPRATHLEFLINDDVKIASQHLTGTTTKEKALFKMTDSEQNCKLFRHHHF